MTTAYRDALGVPIYDVIPPLIWLIVVKLPVPCKAVTKFCTTAVFVSLSKSAVDGLRAKNQQKSNYKNGTRSYDGKHKMDGIFPEKMATEASIAYE